MERKALSQGSIPGASQPGSCPHPVPGTPAPSSAHPSHCGPAVDQKCHPPTASLPCRTSPRAAPHFRDPPQCHQPFISTITGFLTWETLFLQSAVQQDSLNWSSGTRRSPWSWQQWQNTNVSISLRVIWAPAKENFCWCVCLFIPPSPSYFLCCLHNRRVLLNRMILYDIMCYNKQSAKENIFALRDYF